MNELYYDVEKAIDHAFDGQFVLKMYDYLRVCKVKRPVVEEFMHSSTAKEITDLVNELKEYLEGGQDPLVGELELADEAVVAGQKAPLDDLEPWPLVGQHGLAVFHREARAGRTDRAAARQERQEEHRRHQLAGDVGLVTEAGLRQEARKARRVEAVAAAREGDLFRRLAAGFRSGTRLGGCGTGLGRTLRSLLLLRGCHI